MDSFTLESDAVQTRHGTAPCGLGVQYITSSPSAPATPGQLQSLFLRASAVLQVQDLWNDLASGPQFQTFHGVFPMSFRSTLMLKKPRPRPAPCIPQHPVQASGAASSSPMLSEFKLERRVETRPRLCSEGLNSDIRCQ